jgi:hypothetical protein
MLAIRALLEGVNEQMFFAESSFKYGSCEISYLICKK